MSDNFKGSIAQKHVNFPIETVIEPIAGENYSRAMIFVPLSLADTYLSGADSKTANTLIELNSSNYSTITGGLLNTWLYPFFKSATQAIVYAAIFDDTQATTTDDDTTTVTTVTYPLATVYETYKMYAYFKFIIAEDSSTYASLNVELSTLCLTDSLYSDIWIGTSDSNVLTKSSSLISSLNTVLSNARVIYNPDTTINPALAQLGCTLKSINATSTPVGNSIDSVAFSTVSPSGADDDDGNATNLSSSYCTALDDQKIGYNTYVGDGTTNVVTEGSLTLQGESVGANWVKNYITYMCKVKTATLMSKMNAFRNNATYQAILLTLSAIVQDFVDFGRLSDFKITAPAFKDLDSSGDSITVPDAWQATYIDNVREVTVYGTLYLTQPTR